MVALKGMEFTTAFERAQYMDVDGLQVKVIHYNDLIKAKLAAGRPRDLNDVQQLKNARTNSGL